MVSDVSLVFIGHSASNSQNHLARLERLCVCISTRFPRSVGCVFEVKWVLTKINVFSAQLVPTVAWMTTVRWEGRRALVETYY